jgi:hypothetical protein
MLPPDLLHTTKEGTSKYIFESLRKMIGKSNAGTRASTCVERVFLKIHRDLSRNSERDLPHGSSNSGLLKSARIWASQRQGNVLRLLCLIYTSEVQDVLDPILRKHGCSLVKMAKFLKLYLGMEAWFHTENKKNKVHLARYLIGTVIQMLIDLFPRGGQGWHLPKVHGLTQMQEFIILFGSGSNFDTDTGESNHQMFVKDTGTITQKRKDRFVEQTAHHFYQHLVVKIAASSVDSMEKLMFETPDKKCSKNRNKWQGEYSVVVTNMGIHQQVQCVWSAGRKKKEMCAVSENISRFMSTHLIDLGWTQDYTYLAYTEMMLHVDNRYEQFRFCDNYKGKSWHDMCIVECWNEEKQCVETKVAHLLTLVRFAKNVDVMGHIPHVVVKLSHEVVSMSIIESKFVVPFRMSEEMEMLPVSAIKYPLAAWKNKGGEDNQYFSVLPHRKWAQYFSRKIKVN